MPSKNLYNFDNFVDQRFLETTLLSAEKGYSTSVVDADEHGDTAHDAGPLATMSVYSFPQAPITERVQQPDRNWNKTKNAQSSVG